MARKPTASPLLIALGCAVSALSSYFFGYVTTSIGIAVYLVFFYFRLYWDLRK
jgi:hypothetical protein